MWAERSIRLPLLRRTSKQNHLALSIRLPTHPPVKYDCPLTSPLSFLPLADKIHAEYVSQSQRLVTLILLIPIMYYHHWYRIRHLFLIPIIHSISISISILSVIVHSIAPSILKIMTFYVFERDWVHHNIRLVAWYSLVPDFGTYWWSDQLRLECHFYWHARHPCIAWCYDVLLWWLPRNVNEIFPNCFALCLVDLPFRGTWVQISFQRYWRLLSLQDSSWWYSSKATTWSCPLLVYPWCSTTFLLILHSQIGVWYLFLFSVNQVT